MNIKQQYNNCLVMHVPALHHCAFPFWQVVSPNQIKTDCSCEVRIIRAYRQTYECQHFFFLVILCLCYMIPPLQKTSMFPRKYTFEPAKTHAAMSFTEMLNTSDGFSTPTPGNLHSRRFEPDSLDDDDLFSPAQISLASGTTSTSISSVEDTLTTSPAYNRLVRQFTNSQLELMILKREHHCLQYVLPTKTSSKILTLKQVDA